MTARHGERAPTARPAHARAALASAAESTSSVVVLRPVIAALAAHGVDDSELLRCAGLERDQLQDPERRVPEWARMRLWRAAAEASGDEFFGLHAAEYAEIGAYDVLDFAMTLSSSLHDALCRIARFHRLLCDAADVAILHEDNVTLRRKLPPRATYRHECESFFAVILSRLRSVAGFQLRPVQVKFSHAAPSTMDPFLTSFGVSPRFGCHENSMVFDREDTDRPALAPNASLAQLLDRYAAEMQGRLPPQGDLVSQVRAVLSRKLSTGDVNLAAVSSLLRTSPRTLQRKLIALGTTYRDLLEEVRHDLAVGLVKAGSVSATESAFLLGFANPSSYHRVFKRWTGSSPSKFHGVPLAPRRAST